MYMFPIGFVSLENPDIYRLKKFYDSVFFPN